MLESVRAEFELLKSGDFHYLDSAATSLKPKNVSSFLARHYDLDNSSPHRGAYSQSVKATALYEQSKEVVKTFVGASADEVVIYAKNTTEVLNLIAFSLLSQFQAGDKIVVTITSHHSNILPWQRLAQMTGTELVYLYCDNSGAIPQAELTKIDDTVKLVSLPIVSNGIGIIHDIKPIIAKAKTEGALVVLDAAQAVGHIAVDFAATGADFLAFSGHKVYAPQGIGALLAKPSALDKMSPFLLGGDMIEYVTEQSATFAEVPTRFEAGTQNVGGAASLMRAIEWLNKIGLEQIYQHERDMTEALYQMLAARDDIIIYGTEDIAKRGSLVCFNVKSVHPHDVATILDSENVAIRAGHHCCQPLMAYLNISASCRASVGIYTNIEDIDALSRGLDKVSEVFNVSA